MNATIAIPNRTLNKIPVKEGCGRVYIAAHGWTETYGYKTEEEAENAWNGPGYILALDVPHFFIHKHDTWGKGVIFIPKFPDYLTYKVGHRKIGEVTEQTWEG